MLFTILNLLDSGMSIPNICSTLNIRFIDIVDNIDPYDPTILSTYDSYIDYMNSINPALLWDYNLRTSYFASIS